MLIHLR